MSDDHPPSDFEEPTPSQDPRRAHSEPEGLLLTEPVPADHPSLAPAGFLIDRWRAERQRVPGVLPSRDAFAPETLGGLLGRVSLLEPVDCGSDFVFRIHAGIAADVGGIDLGGKRVGDMPYPAYRQAVIGMMSAAVATAEPRFQRVRLNWFGTIYDYVDVALPILDPAKGSPLVLSVMLHFDVERPTYVSRFRSVSSGDGPLDGGPDVSGLNDDPGPGTGSGEDP